MTTNSVLRLFLTLSIVIILAGILIIVFLQVDRGYPLTGGDSELHAQQQKLISHVYTTQGQTDTSSDITQGMRPSRTLPKMPTVVDQNAFEQAPLTASETTASIQPAPVQPLPQPAPPAMANPRLAPPDPRYDYYTQLLRNNPWSPHYQPGY